MSDELIVQGVNAPSVSVELQSPPEVAADLTELRYLVFEGQKGDKGDTGSQGPQGITGPQGPQGPAGEDALPCLVVHYGAQAGAFDSSYDEIIQALSDGRDVRCEIECGNSVFYARLSRRYTPTYDPEIIYFDYHTYDYNDDMWWGQLSINELDQIYYREGHYTVTEN